MIREMSIDDYGSVMGLLATAEGVSLREADSRPATQRYLARNPGMSLVAQTNGELVGCVMGGHDGRRGYLQHLFVRPDFRNRGIGSELVSQCLEALAAEGILKSHIFVIKTNEAGQRYWARAGWSQRSDIVMYSHIHRGGENV